MYDGGILLLCAHFSISGIYHLKRKANSLLHVSPTEGRQVPGFDRQGSCFPFKLAAVVSQQHQGYFLTDDEPGTQRNEGQPLGIS